MQIQFQSTVLFVKDINKSKRFYQDVLQCEIAFDFGRNVIFMNGLSVWELFQEHIIGKSAEMLGVHERNNRFEIYFETDDFHALVKYLEKMEVDFFHAEIEEPWGQRTIRLFDPDKHMIEIGEKMEVFVKRFYTQGLSIEEIATKTSIKEKDIRRILDQNN